MNISPQERKRLNDTLISIMETSQRSIVSLRKDNFDDLSMDVDSLAVSIATFLTEFGAELLPTQAL